MAITVLIFLLFVKRLHRRTTDHERSLNINISIEERISERKSATIFTRHRRVAGEFNIEIRLYWQFYFYSFVVVIIRYLISKYYYRLQFSRFGPYIIFTPNISIIYCYKILLHLYLSYIFYFSNSLKWWITLVTISTITMSIQPQNFWLANKLNWRA